MNSHFRMLRVFTAGLFRRKPAESLLDPCVLSLRVWPMDLDFNLHKNNGRYLTTMDVGRMDFAFRAGLFGPMIKQKWMPLLGSSTIRYFRSLKPFQRFELVTRLVGWDEKWVFIEQQFRSGGQLYAVGAVKVLFRGPHGNVPTTTLLRYANVTGKSPDLPDYMLHWHMADRELGQTFKDPGRTRHEKLSA